MASQDARLSKFKADFKQQQSEMTNKIDTVLKAITDRMTGALPSDTVKNPKLSVNYKSLVLSARSCPTKDPQCSTQIYSSINTIIICPKQPNKSLVNKPEEEQRNEKGSTKSINTIELEEGPKDIPQLEPKDTAATKKIGSSGNDEEKEEMPRCSLNYDIRIRKGDPRNHKIPCMIGHKFLANACIDVDLPMNSIRKDGYEYRGRNFVGLERDMHVFVRNMSYVMDFTILENIETNIDPSLSHVVFGRPFVKIACLAITRKHRLMTFMDGIREVTFKTSYKDPELSELTREGHDLLSSRVILSKDDYDRGCRRLFDLENGFYKGTLKLGHEYRTGLEKRNNESEMNDEGEVTNKPAAWLTIRSGRLAPREHQITTSHPTGSLSRPAGDLLSSLKIFLVPSFTPFFKKKKLLKLIPSFVLLLMNTRSTGQEPTTPYSEPECFIYRTKKKKKTRNPFIPIENRIPKDKYPPLENLFEALVVYSPFLDLPFPMTDDQPMWGNNRAVAPTPGAAILVVDLGDNFTVKGHHLSMIKDRQFEGRGWADPHKHIAEFIEIYRMFRYGNTNADAIKLKLFPSSLSGDAKIDSQFKEIKGEMKEMRDGCNSCGGPHPSSECDDKPIGGPKDEEVNYAYGGYRGGGY
ncbi:hypothetical protein Tco_1538350 [Tanacetum coccineum]